MAMERQYKISSFDDLIYFIENEEASLKEIENIINQTLRVIVISGEDYDKSLLIEELKTFWNKFKNSQERPIFLDLMRDSLDVETDNK